MAVPFLLFLLVFSLLAWFTSLWWALKQLRRMDPVYKAVKSWTADQTNVVALLSIEKAFNTGVYDDPVLVPPVRVERSPAAPQGEIEGGLYLPKYNDAERERLRGLARKGSGLLRRRVKKGEGGAQ